jgi:hypothetical protein
MCITRESHSFRICRQALEIKLFIYIFQVIFSQKWCGETFKDEEFLVNLLRTTFSINLEEKLLILLVIALV